MSKAKTQPKKVKTPAAKSNRELALDLLERLRAKYPIEGQLATLDFCEVYVAINYLETINSNHVAAAARKIRKYA